MPAGTSWPRYVGAVVGAMVSMFAGAQAVHIMYQPLRDLDEKVEAEKLKLRNANATSGEQNSSTTSPDSTNKTPSVASNTS